MLHWTCAGPWTRKRVCHFPPQNLRQEFSPGNISRFLGLPLRTNALQIVWNPFSAHYLPPTNPGCVPQMPLDEVILLRCPASVTQKDQCRSLWCFRAPHGTTAGYPCHHDQNRELVARHGRGAIHCCCCSPDHAWFLEERVRSETFPPCSPCSFRFPPVEIQIIPRLPSSASVYC